MNKFLIALGISTVLLSGCSSSSNDVDKQLELLASNRATLIQAQLPVEDGPISVMRASSNGRVIEIMMIYNEDAPNARPVQSVFQSGISHYCSDPETKSNLEAGLAYRIKIRNSRGQLMIDKIIDKKSCGSDTNTSNTGSLNTSSSNTGSSNTK
jgi:hypothetical protein